MPSLRPYQERASAFLSAHRLALCVCPAGGGKTIIGASALARVTDGLDRIGWVCNTREQVEQGQAALAAMGVQPEWVRCAAGLKPEDVARLDFLIFDEAHHLASAVTWQMLFAACKGVIWGLTATPRSGNIDRDDFFMKLWGGNIITIPRAEVEGGGHLARGVVRILDLDIPGEFDGDITANCARHLLEDYANHRKWKDRIGPLITSQRFASHEAVALLTEIAQAEGERFDTSAKRHEWRQALKRVLENPRRNDAAVSTAKAEMAEGKTVIVLVGKIEQGQAIADRIPGAVMAHSKMGIKARRAAMAGMRDGSIRCMVATSLADEGLDIPRASALIYATFGRSIRLVEQRSGRVMRTHEDKEFGIVYDFADQGASMARAQAKARQRVYKKLGYTIETPNPARRAA